MSRISKHVATQQTSGRSAGNGHPADAARPSPLRTNMAPERSVGGPFDAGRLPGPANTERPCRADRFVTKLTYSYLPVGATARAISIVQPPQTLPHIDGRFANFLK